MRRVSAAIAFTMVVSVAALAQDDAPRRLDAGRFTAVFFPQDDRLARTLLASAARMDTFPWLPRPKQQVLIAIAPDARRFRAWAGTGAPEWGVAVAFPESRRVVMQGQSAGSSAGDPVETLRHELAHLALHERLGNRPPRWFDEGYASVAAREWRREDVLTANMSLALRGAPSLAQLERGFTGGPSAVQSSYALSFRAVTELASLDPERGLTLFFRYWEGGSDLETALRQAFGRTLVGFEREFQQRTRRRYGALALFADLSLAFLVLSLLVLPLFVTRRARDRRRLRELLAADAAAEQAERESILAMLLEIGAPSQSITGGVSTAPAEPPDDASADRPTGSGREP